jgi:protein-S-isoprenylcysteine O-methyltransferase Ste14
VPLAHVSSFCLTGTLNQSGGYKYPMRFLLVVISGSAYLLLPILGWGGFRPFFAHPALTALAIVVIVACVAAFFAGGNVSSGEREDRGNRWVLVVFTIVGLLLGYIPALTDRLGILTIDGDTMRWIGVVLFVIGCGVRLWPVVVLGKRFSGLVAIQKGHTLQTTGIYSVIRHPSYLGLLITLLGWALAFRSVVGIALGALLIPALVGRMNAEEALLRSQFGTEYDAYRARTKRLIPGFY